VKYAKNIKQVLSIFCGVGFVLGIVYGNVAYLKNQEVFTLFQRETLERVITKEIVSGEYFLYVLRMRLRMLLPCCMIGLVKWKKLFVNLFLLWTGFLFGIFLSNAIIAQAFVGIILCLVMLFPHILFYIWGYYLILGNYYRYPEQRWNVQKILICILFFLIGILSETYINPWLVKGILRWLQ